MNFDFRNYRRANVRQKSLAAFRRFAQISWKLKLLENGDDSDPENEKHENPTTAGFV